VSFRRSSIPFADLSDSYLPGDEDGKKGSMAVRVMEKLVQTTQHGYAKGLVLPRDNFETSNSVICFHFSTIVNSDTESEGYSDEEYQLYALAMLYLDGAPLDAVFNLASVVIPQSEPRFNAVSRAFYWIEIQLSKDAS